MRKNGVNRQLQAIEGGVCAPTGFQACGKDGLALIVGEKRFPVACTFSQSAVIGAPVALSKRHVKSGYARAVFVNSGVANVCQENGEKAAKEICINLAKRLRCDMQEIVIASTGKIGPRFPLERILQGMEDLTERLGVSHEHSLSAARAMITTDNSVKQVSFAFDVGAFRCKIGAIFKGNARVCPNMATTLCFLTTDVNITPQMLQKALNASVQETLNALHIDGLSSPNDTACILSSCTAGNYKIFCADSEYKKFASALQKTLTEICLLMVKDGDENNKTLVCTVRGAKSKRVARAVAKAIVGARIINGMNGINGAAFETENLLCAIIGAGENLEISKADAKLSSERGSVTLMTDGKAIAFSSSVLVEILSAGEITLSVHLNDGNYGATAFSRLTGI